MEVTKFKSRLVAKGYSQTPGIDFNETYSSVAPIIAIRTILATVVLKNYYIRQIDVKTAYLYADLEEQLYMEIPEGIGENDKNKCWLLKKALYGTKQRARCWFKECSMTLLGMGFQN